MKSVQIKPNIPYLRFCLYTEGENRQKKQSAAEQQHRGSARGTLRYSAEFPKLTNRLTKTSSLPIVITLYPRLFSTLVCIFPLTTICALFKVTSSTCCHHTHPPTSTATTLVPGSNTNPCMKPTVPLLTLLGESFTNDF